MSLQFLEICNIFRRVFLDESLCSLLSFKFNFPVDDSLMHESLERKRGYKSQRHHSMNSLNLTANYLYESRAIELVIHWKK